MECRDERAVFDACENVADVFPHEATVVPPDEIGDLLSPKEEKECKEGDWVVIGKGMYRGDIGQVEKISRNAEFLTVKTVPRIAKSKRKQAKRQRKEKRSRPLAYRLKFEEAKEFGDAVEDSDDEGFEFKGAKFDKAGFILLQVDYRDAPLYRPTMEEISPFVDAAMETEVAKHLKGKQVEDAHVPLAGQDCTDLDIFKIAKLNPEHLTIPSYLRIGDNVRGTGVNKGLTGRVKEMKGDSRVIISLDDDKKTRVEVRDEDVERVFELGESVEVKTGVCAGKYGVVVGVEEKSIVGMNLFLREEGEGNEGNEVSKVIKLKKERKTRLTKEKKDNCMG